MRDLTEEEAEAKRLAYNAKQRADWRAKQEKLKANPPVMPPPIEPKDHANRPMLQIAMTASIAASEAQSLSAQFYEMAQCCREGVAPALEYGLGARDIEFQLRKLRASFQALVTELRAVNMIVLPEHLRRIEPATSGMASSAAAVADRKGY